jgi:hypothetical protein
VILKPNFERGNFYFEKSKNGPHIEYYHISFKWPQKWKMLKKFLLRVTRKYLHSVKEVFKNF